MDLGVEFFKLVLSAAVGFGGGLFSERYRRFNTTVDLELARLDDLVDIASQRAELVERGVPCGPDILADLGSRRQRLGQNLRRLFAAAPTYPDIADRLGLLAATLSGLDPGPSGPNLTLADDIQAKAENLRRAIHKVAAKRFLWRFMRAS